MKVWFKFKFVALILLAVIVVCTVPFIWPYFSFGKKIDRILLISIDTCRADYLGCYGYSLQTTPNIDKLSQQGVMFENVISPVPMTLPAHCSILTGTIPPYHGVHDNFDYQLGSFNVTLAELLKEEGFATGAVVSTFIMDSHFGLSQGFDEYEDKIEEGHRPLNVQVNERKGGQSNLLAINWLVEHKNDPFFLFLHYFDPHVPYDPPEPFASKFADNLYAGEIAYTDHCIGQIMEKLKQLKLYDSTLIIITGDHGEMLGEHGERDHSYFIYQSALKVPLIIKLPGRNQSKKITGLVGLVDIMPTICSLVGIMPPEEIGGIDLSGYFRYQEHPPQERYLYCESLTATKYNANSLLGVVTNGWKYIQTTHPELYDLAEDPQESNNLVEREPKRTLVLKGHLELILEEQLHKDSDSGLKLDEQARIRLESLGYVSGNVSEDFEFDQSKDDPKDLVGFHNANTDLAHLVSQRRYAEAKVLCEKMLQERPLFFTGHFTMGRIALEQRDYTTAVSYLSRALELKPGDGVTHNNLGLALKEQGKLDEAINHFHQALEVQPNSAQVYNNLGLTVRAQGRLDEAIIHFQKALESKMDSAEAHYNLGTSLQLKGKLDEAVGHYLQTIRLQPDFAPAHYNLGVAMKSQGKIDEAIRHFVLALKFKPDYAKAHYNLGNVLIMKGQVDAALKHFREAQRLMPNWAAPSRKIELILAARSGTKILDPNQPEE